MSLPLAPKGFIPVGDSYHSLVPVYMPGKDQGDSAAAGYPGDLVVAVAAGPRILKSDTDTAQVKVLGVLQNYIPSGTSDAWYSLISPRGLFMCQCGAPTSSVTWANADIGLGVDLTCSTAADTTALISKTSVLGKEGTNSVAIFMGIAPMLGNDNTVSASNYPWLLLRFLPSIVFPYDNDI